MTAGLSVRPTPAACRISTASPILPYPSLITVFRVVPTLVSHENGSQWTRLSSLAGMEVEPCTWYSSRDTHPSIDPAHWWLTSQPCQCPNHHHNTPPHFSSQYWLLLLNTNKKYKNAESFIYVILRNTLSATHFFQISLNTTVLLCPCCKQRHWVILLS